MGIGEERCEAAECEAGSLTDCAWGIYFGVLAILAIARPKQWPAGAVVAIITLSGVIAMCRSRRIRLELRRLWQLVRGVNGPRGRARPPI